MTDIFNSEQAVTLLKGKTVLFLGGSVTRGLYKDLIWLLNSNTLLPRQILGQKGEASFPDFSRAGGEYQHRFKFRDQLQQEDFHGAVPDCLTITTLIYNKTITAGLNRGRNYQETREYINTDLDIRICFK